MQPFFPEDQFEQLIGRAVAKAVTASDLDDFLAWFRDEIAGEALVGERLDEPGVRVLGTLLGRSVWSATPAPRNDFRPKPLPAPGRNEPCICGSGRKFKRCCAGAPPLSPLNPAELWPFVLESLPAAGRKAAIQSGRVPVESLAMTAQRAVDAGKGKSAVGMLEPLFEAGFAGTDDRHGMALYTLCDAYDALGWERKKVDLLERVRSGAARSPLRSDASQRLATIALDRGDSPGAWAAFREAQRDDPDSPAIGLLEVQLLIFEHRVDEARERARFWRRRLERLRDPSLDDSIEFLTAIIEDPGSALAGVAIASSAGAGSRLSAAIAELGARPEPQYTLVPGAEFRIVAPPALRTLEADWRAIYPIGKPFSVNPAPQRDEDQDLWDSAVEDRWMSFLERHPEAFDSIDILDDLACAVELHPASHVLHAVGGLQQPLVERAVRILRRAVDDKFKDSAKNSVPDTVTLPWLDTANRPALRCLYTAHALAAERGDLAHAREYAVLLLRLNPGDNHGVRAGLMNLLLRAGDDEAALALAASFPDDMLAEIPYGKVLALARLGRQREAAAAAHDAAAALPEVRRYLMRERAKRPRIDAFGVRVGGKDQAWFYREDMRDVWLKSPEALELVRKATVS